MTLRKTQFYESYHFHDAWQYVMRPWLEDQAISFSKNAVLLPNLAQLHLLKKALIDSSINCLGLSFFTPETLRQYLLKKCKNTIKRVATQADLILLAKSLFDDQSPSFPIHDFLEIYPIYSKFFADPFSKPENSLEFHEPSRLKDVLSSQEDLRREDTLICDSQKIQNAHCLKDPPWKNQKKFQEILQWVEKFKTLLQQVDLETLNIIDTYLSQNTQLAFDNLLIYGFSNQHWPLLQCLQVAYESSSQTVLCHVFQEDSISYQTWMGTWENSIGPAIPVPSAKKHNPLFSSLAESLEFATPYESIYPCLRLTKNIQEESQSIFCQALTFLSSESCTQLGIVFSPHSQNLAREVSILLDKANIPHCDTFGYYTSSDTVLDASPLFKAWVQWQNENDLSSLLSFLRQLRIDQRISASLLKKIENAYLFAFRDLRIEELSLLNDYLLATGIPFHISLVEWLNTTWPRLPEVDSLDRFLQSTLSHLRPFSPPSLVEKLKEPSSFFYENFTTPITRSIFLEWFGSRFFDSEKRATDSGAYIDARIILLTPVDAANHTWSHLILGGLNAFDWPYEKKENALLSDSDIQEINAFLIEEGSQGEGHLMIKPSFFYLTPSSYTYNQSKKSFYKLLSLAEEDLVLTASCENTNELSEILIELYALHPEKIFEKNCIQALQAKTRCWIQSFQAFLPCHSYSRPSSIFCEKPFEANNSSDTKFRPYQEEDYSNNPQTTQYAYRLRRDPKTPFGSYDFCYPPRELLSLSCKALEEVFKTPTQAWLKYILKVPLRFNPSEEVVDNLAIGTWVHDWLYLNNPSDFTNLLTSANQRSQELYDRICSIFKAKNRPIPDWWLATWHDAKRLAQSFAETLQSQGPWPEIRMEYTFKSENNLLNIPLQGRIDLLLLDPLRKSAWIIDFKTGADKPLTLKSLAEGHGLQLALYAFALESTGYDSVEISLLRPDMKLKPDLNFESMQSLSGLWKTLSRIANQGLFGNLLSLRTSSQNMPFPIATLPIDPSILIQKSKRTHPDFY